MKPDKSLAVLTKELDDVFSKYIRNKYSHDGYCYCFICSKRMRISEAQCGHFIDRDQMATRYDERELPSSLPVLQLRRS